MLDNQLITGLLLIGNPKEIIHLLDSSTLSREEALKHPPLIRASLLVDKIEQIFIAMPIHIQMTYMINDMLCQYYSSTDPSSPEHIMRYYGNSRLKPTIAALIEGYPGVGKTKFISKLLSSIPQVVTHENFPHFMGPYKQVVWFSISITADSKKGFYRELANAWNALIKQNSPNLQQPISNEVINKGTGDLIFEKFLTSAINHNIGLIHFDEIQNLFGLKSRFANQSYKKTEVIKDTALLGNILGLFNTGIPILISCTPDGTRGLEKKGAVIQRTGSNFIRMDYMQAKEKDCRRYVEKLFEYQYTDQQLEFNEEIYQTLVKLGAGVPRLIMRIFLDSQKNALRNGKAKIDLNDMKLIVKRFSPTLKKLIQAIHNGDRNYLDTLTDY